MKNSGLIIFVAIISLALGAFAGVVLSNKPLTLGSVTVGNEYTATTTPYGGGGYEDKLLKLGTGSLGSVIITGAGDSIINFYDATSTRAIYQVGFSSTTKRLVSLPASLAAGTYVFDLTFNQGLVLDQFSGTTGTSTITFR